MTLEALQRNIKTVNIPEITTNIIVRNSSVFISSVKEQLSHGIMVSNSGVSERKTYSNKHYAATKYKMNPTAGGAVDLRYTGSFYNGIYLDQNYFSVPALFSNDTFKMEKLTQKYGTGILNIGKESMHEINIKTISPQIVNEVNKMLQK